MRSPTFARLPNSRPLRIRRRCGSSGFARRLECRAGPGTLRGARQRSPRRRQSPETLRLARKRSPRRPESPETLRRARKRSPRRAGPEGKAPHAYEPRCLFHPREGNGVGLIRDWPTLGYTFKPYSPTSEPEVSAFGRTAAAVADRLGGETASAFVAEGEHIDPSRGFPDPLSAGPTRPPPDDRSCSSTGTGYPRRRRTRWNVWVSPRRSSSELAPAVSDEVFAGLEERGH